MEMNELFRRARLEKGLTQEQCGDAVGLTASAYGKIENGLRQFRMEYASKLCLLLGVRPMDAFRCAFGDGAPDTGPHGRAREEDIHMNLHDKMIRDAADLLHGHVRLACDAIRLSVPEGYDAARTLALLLAKLLFDGRLQIESPDEWIRREIRFREACGCPAPPDEEDELASCAMDFVPFWQGSAKAPLADIVRNMAVYADAGDLDRISPPGEINAGREAYRHAYDALTEAHDEAVAGADAAFREETAGASEAYHAAVDAFQAAYNSAYYDEQHAIKEDAEAAAAAKRRTEEAMKALDEAKSAASPAWRAVRDPARAKADAAIAEAGRVREEMAREAMAAARADYRARHGLAPKAGD